jgi:hypothetical protein
LIFNLYECREQIAYLHNYERICGQPKLSNLLGKSSNKKIQPPQSYLFYQHNSKQEEIDLLRSRAKKWVDQDERKFYTEFIDKWLQNKTKKKAVIEFASDNLIMIKRYSRQN